jgi:allophanate hydrolase subunit 2
LLTFQAWTVDPASSRVGLRLSGPALQRSHDGELAPEGMVTGSIQVPPNGLPVLLLADHPTTGGYPVIAVAREADLHHAAQAAPGSTLRFRLLGP